MASSELDLGGSYPVLRIPDDVLKLVEKGAGKPGVAALKASVDGTNTRNKLAAVAKRATEHIKTMNANVRSVVGDLSSPTQALAVVLGGGAGAYVGYVGYDYLRAYFGPGYAPDAIVAGGGIAIGYFGAQIKDRKGLPGSMAQVRSAALGFGGGMTLAGLMRSYQTYT